MVAIAWILGRWQAVKETGAAFPTAQIDCGFCKDGWIGGKKCGFCDRDGIVECLAQDPTHLIEGDSPENVFDLARAIVYARERKWIPTEFGAQPVLFVEAFERFQRQVANYLEDDRVRRKNDR